MGEKMHFFTQCTFSQSYFMLLINKTYQHNPQSILINEITLIMHHMTVT